MITATKLRCSRFQMDMEPEDAKCPAPESYCKFRSSCLIWCETRKRELTEKNATLRARLEELRKRMPAHSMPASMASSSFIPKRCIIDAIRSEANMRIRLSSRDR